MKFRRFSFNKNLKILLVAPVICSAKIMIIIPPMISIVLLYMMRYSPSAPTAAPTRRRIDENPIVKRIACRRIFNL